jgi:HTH-type transcriptional regulator/antitoxin HigA
MTASAFIEPIALSWKAFKASSGIGHIRTEEQYDQITELMNQLADLGAMDESNELHEVFMLAADVVQRYEAQVHPNPPVSGVDVLRFLMDQHGLKQSDLKEEFGTQSVVSEVLSGKRELNKAHIEALSRRFNVSPSAFFS